MAFALEMIKASRNFPKTEAAMIIKRQLLRSATSVGGKLSIRMFCKITR
jgi:four helix bundle protein